MPNSILQDTIEGIWEYLTHSEADYDQWGKGANSGFLHNTNNFLLDGHSPPGKGKHHHPPKAMVNQVAMV
jgi:hypothetical protein